MTVKSKLTILLVLIFLFLFVIIGYITNNSYKLFHQLDTIKISIDYSYEIEKIRSLILAQMSLFTNYYSVGKTFDDRLFKFYKKKVSHSFIELEKTLKMQAPNSVVEKDEDLTEIADLKEKYLEFTKHLEGGFNNNLSNIDEYRKIRNSVLTWNNEVVLKSFNGLIKDGIDKIHKNYYNLLILLGSMPWISDKNTADIDRALFYNDYFIIINDIYYNINSHSKDLIDYLLYFNEHTKNHYTEIKNVTKDLFESIKKLSGKEKNISLYNTTLNNKNISDIEKSYYNLLDSSSSIFQLEDTDSTKNIEEAFELMKSKINPLINTRLLPKVSLEFKNIKIKIIKLNNKITQTTQNALISAFIVFVILSSLAVFLFMTLSRQIILTIEKLKAFSVSIGNGDLDCHVNLKGNDELKGLAEELNKMRRALKKTTVSKDYLDNIINSMLNFIVIITSDGIIESINPITLSLLGYEEKMLIGESIDKIIFQGDNFTPKSIMQFIVNEHITHKDLFFVTSEGEKISVYFSSSPLVDKRQEVYGYVCVGQDLTAKKEDEVKLEKAYETLKNTQNQLLENEKMAVIGQLITGVAHEINTPIGAISNSVSTLKNQIDILVKDIYLLKDLDDALLIKFNNLLNEILATSIKHKIMSRSLRKEIEALFNSKNVALNKEILDTMVLLNCTDQDKILTYIDIFKNSLLVEMLHSIGNMINTAMICTVSTEKVKEIIKALKFYSHTGTQKAEAININESIATTLILLNNKLKYSVEILTQLDENIPLVCGTSDLSQVWTNLINNAHDAIQEYKEEKGEGYTGQIVIKTDKYESTRGDHDSIIVTIKDNGIGIPLHIKEKLFEPFFTTKAIGKGTGLGLSIISKIIKRHNGQININSKKGDTVFEIILPAGEKPNTANTVIACSKPD